MAALTITVGNVLPGENANVITGRAGVSVTAGAVVYADPTASGDLKLADSDSATAAVRQPIGIALHGSLTGQALTYITKGDLTLGSILTGGLPYFLSPDTPGGICPIADVAVGDDYVQIGIAKSATVLAVDIKITGFTRVA